MKVQVKEKRKKRKMIMRMIAIPILIYFFLCLSLSIQLMSLFHMRNGTEDIPYALCSEKDHFATERIHYLMRVSYAKWPPNIKKQLTSKCTFPLTWICGKKAYSTYYAILYTAHYTLDDKGDAVITEKHANSHPVDVVWEWQNGRWVIVEFKEYVLGRTHPPADYQ